MNQKSNQPPSGAAAPGDKAAHEPWEQRLATGDVQTFLELVDATFDHIYRMVRILLGKKSEAEDAMREILLRAFQGRNQFRGGEPVVWLFKIAHHYCLDQLRKHQPTPGQEALAEQPELAWPSLSPDSGLPDFLLLLSLHQREMLLLRGVEGLSYADISTITGLTEGTLRNLYSRTVRDLRKDSPDQVPPPRPAVDGKGDHPSENPI